MLQISFLGAVEVLYDGHLLPPFPTKKAQSLFSYLVLNAGKTLSREFLAELFWPDRTEENSRRSLHTALWQIRNTFKACNIPTDQYLITTNRSVTWVKNSGDWLDVDAFTAAYNSANMSERKYAVTLYRGNLLAHLDDDWCIEERSRLAIHYLETLKTLVEYCFTVKDFLAGLEYARMMISADPLNEDANRGIIYALHQLGNRTGVIKHYKRFSNVLKEELGILPSEETQKLYRQVVDGVLSQEPQRIPTPNTASLQSQRGRVTGRLGTEQISSTSPGVDAFERKILIQRQQELHALERWWLHQKEIVAQVNGFQGIGKTRLMQEFSMPLKSQDTLVGCGRCYPFSQKIPYQVVREVLCSLLESTPLPLRETIPAQMIADLAAFCPDLVAIAGIPSPKNGKPAEQSNLFDAFSGLLSYLAKFFPILLVIDDLNWMDDSTQLLVEFLAWHFQNSSLKERQPVRILTSINPGKDLPGTIISMNARFHREGLLQELHLHELSLQEIEQWLSIWHSRMGQTDVLAGHLHRQVGGNPFLIIETVKAGIRSGDLRLTESGWEGPAVERGFFPVSPSIRSVIEEQFSCLSPLARRVFEAASVIGFTFNVDMLLRALQVDEEMLLHALEELLRARLIRELQKEIFPISDFSFSNQLIQQSIYNQVTQTRRSMLHRRLQAHDVPLPIQAVFSQR